MPKIKFQSRKYSNVQERNIKIKRENFEYSE